MGHIAAALADITLITAEDPRTESLDTIIAETAQAMQAAGVIEGQSFARALEQYPKIFSPLFINMVRAGESSGTLEVILERHDKHVGPKLHHLPVSTFHPH